MTPSIISQSSLAEEYDRYFVWFHTTKPYFVKENWQAKEEKIFEWFESHGVQPG